LAPAIKARRKALRGNSQNSKTTARCEAQATAREQNYLVESVQFTALGWAERFDVHSSWMGAANYGLAMVYCRLRLFFADPGFWCIICAFFFGHHA